MKLLSVFRKSLREQLRDLTSLTLLLVAAPFFIFLYWLLLGGGSTTYTVLLVNQDNTTAVEESLRAVTYEDGSPLLKVQVVGSRAEAEQMLRNRDGDMAVIVPEGFSTALHGGPRAAVVFTGDMTNPRYRLTGILAITALDALVKQSTGMIMPVDLAEEPLDQSGARTEFETYVPGLLVVAVEMLLYKVAIELTAEVQAGTLRRLRLTRMRAIDLLGGISLTHLVVGILATLLAFATAALLGFHSQGPVWAAMLVTGLTTFAVVGFGLMTAAFARTPVEATVVATFPMLGLMFFSGSAFPLPKVELFKVAGRVIGLYDILPTTHAVNALSKVMTLGAGLREIRYELVAVAVLSAVYFALGVWLFHRRHLRVQV
jgi:ABC-2 type transport system permease protein